MEWKFKLEKKGSDWKERGPLLDDFVLTSILALIRVDDNMELLVGGDTKLVGGYTKHEEIAQNLPDGACIKPLVHNS